MLVQPLQMLVECLHLHHDGVVGGRHGHGHGAIRTHHHSWSSWTHGATGTHWHSHSLWSSRSHWHSHALWATWTHWHPHAFRSTWLAGWLAFLTSRPSLGHRGPWTITRGVLPGVHWAIWAHHHARTIWPHGHPIWTNRHSSGAHRHSVRAHRHSIGTHWHSIWAHGHARPHTWVLRRTRSSCCRWCSCWFWLFLCCVRFRIFTFMFCFLRLWLRVIGS